MFYKASRYEFNWILLKCRLLNDLRRIHSGKWENVKKMRSKNLDHRLISWKQLPCISTSACRVTYVKLSQKCFIVHVILVLKQNVEILQVSTFTQKWPWAMQGYGCPIYSFLSAWLYDYPFSSYSQKFEISTRTGATKTRNITRLNVSRIHCTLN